MDKDEKPKRGRGRQPPSDADAALLARLRPPTDLGHVGGLFRDSADGVLVSGRHKGDAGPVVVPLFPSRPGYSPAAGVSLLTLDDGRLWVRGLLPVLGWEPGPLVVQGLTDRSVPLLVLWPGEPTRARPFREVSRLDVRGRVPLPRASREVVGVETTGQLLAWVRPLASTAKDERMGLALVARPGRAAALADGCGGRAVSAAVRPMTVAAWVPRVSDSWSESTRRGWSTYARRLVEEFGDRALDDVDGVELRALARRVRANAVRRAVHRDGASAEEGFLP